MVKCYVNRRGKDFLSFEEARELVRGMGLLGQEVREPSLGRKCAEARGDTFREVGVHDARRIMLAMVHSTVPPAPTHTRRLRRLSHTLLIIQHTISLFRTRSFALGVWVSIRERTSGYHHRTY
jgi:hypothetical protein